MLFGTLAQNSGYPVSRAFSNDQHELHRFLLVRVFPVTYIRTDGTVLRWAKVPNVA